MPRICPSLTPARARVWYDRKLRLYTAIAYDAKGDQVGEAQYDAVDPDTAKSNLVDHVVDVAKFGDAYASPRASAWLRAAAKCGVRWLKKAE